MYPLAFAAGAVALYFMAEAFRRPRPAGIVAMILWAAYAGYEYHVANGTLCDANCNIRVDLILAWPLLAIATFYAANTPAQWSVVRKVLGVLALIVLVLLVAPLVYIALVGFPADTPSAPASQPSPK
ncbi:MAG: hypothetical protein ABL908_12695 [Hyphomicrobium sp.]